MSKLADRYAAFATVSILGALCVRAPALSAGLIADDWDHYAMSAGIYPVSRGPLDHFDFIGREPQEHRAMQAAGRMPWWILPDLRIGLFRPMASLLGEIDFAWLDGYHHPGRMHAHSLAWWLILVIGAARLLRLLLPPAAAVLGTLLYALDDAHILPATWVANRSELVANAFAIWALYCSVRATQTVAKRSSLMRVASFGLAAAALLAGEHAIPALTYLIAFELRRAEQRWYQRLRNVAPVLGLSASYLVIRHLLGYGTSAVGMYVEPLADPLHYLRACGVRLPLLFGDVVFGVAADWYPAAPPFGVNWASLQLAVGWLALALVIASVVWLSRPAADQSQGTLRWLLLAAAASILPMCGSVAMSRLTLSAALGVDAAWALCIYELGKRARKEHHVPRLALVCMLAVGVFWVHLAGASLRGLREARFYARLSHFEAAWARLDGLDVRGRHVLLLSSGCAAQWVIPFVRHLNGLPMPRSSTPLSAAFLSPHELIRTSANVLELRLPVRPTGATFTDSVYRPSGHPFRAGDRIVAPDFEVHVLAVDAGEPTWLRFEFPTPLDDPKYLFLHATPQRLTPLILPPVGQRLTLPPAGWPAAQSSAQR